MIAVVYGTRPEAIKLAPVIEQLRKRGVATRVVCTGQHDSLLRAQTLTPDVDLSLMTHNQSPTYFVARAMTALEALWRYPSQRPSRVVVQGDTATALAAALAAFHLQIPVAHVEAGLRSYDLRAPFPEEGYRQCIDRLADRHFAATEHAAENLRTEGIHEAIVTGNTCIDAALAASRRGGRNHAKGESPYVLVTLHRRESFGEPMRRVCKAIQKLAGRGGIKPLTFFLPMHPNPAARAVIQEELADYLHVSLIEPLGYDDLIATMIDSFCILTDSGGIQEEAPIFGVPVLVAREATERPEGIAAGAAMLVGCDTDKIVRAVTMLRDDQTLYAQMAQPRFIYGDGRAAERIASNLQQ